MPKIITSFSHKGGVGKTTLLHNIAIELCNRKKKVLVVDADSQMNLTCAIHGLSTNTIYNHPSPSTDSNTSWQDRLGKTLSLHDIVSGIFSNVQNQSNDDSYLTKKPLFQSAIGKPFLLSGSIDLSILEWQLYMLASIPTLTSVNLPAMIEKCIKKIAESNSVDYILVDTSPSANSLINASFVMMSDYFYAPLLPDLFSAQVVDSLGQVIDNWRKQFQPFFVRRDSLNLSINRKFIGIVVNRDKRYKQKDSERNNTQCELFDENIYAGYVKEWTALINKRLKESVKLLRALDCAISEDEFREYFLSADPFVIKGCPDFTGSFRNQADKAGCSVMEIEEGDEDEASCPLKDFKASIRGIVDGFMRLP